MSFDPIQAIHQDPRLADIRRQVEGLSDQIPFLLLPVRLETRFMRVDKTVAQGGHTPWTIRELLAHLAKVEKLLVFLSELNFAVPAKPERKALYAQIEAAMVETRQALAQINQHHDDPMPGTPAQRAEILSLAARLTGLADELPVKARALRSNYLRPGMVDDFARLRQETVVPVLGRIRAVVIPKLDYFNALSPIKASDAAQDLQAAGYTAGSPARRVKVTPQNYLSALKQMDADTRQWHQLDQGCVLGTPEEIFGLQQIRENVLADFNRRVTELTNLRKKLSATESPDQQALWKRLQTHQALFRRPSKPRSLVNRDLTHSATAYVEITQALATAKVLLSDLARSRSAKTQAQIVQELENLATKIFGLTQAAVVWPAVYLQTVQAAVRELDLSGAASRLTGTAKPLAGRVEHTNQRMAQALVRIEAAEGRLFGVLTTTQDELWVRIYPDDIAVHTHESELTADEAEAGKAYWKEAWLAGQDDVLKKEAWHRLRSRFGQPRAAWIAKQLQPKIKVAPGRDLPGQLHAVGQQLSRVRPLDDAAWIRELEAAAEGVESLSSVTPNRKDQLRNQWLTIRGQVEAAGRQDPHAAGIAARMEKALAGLSSVDVQRLDPHFFPLVFPAVTLKAEAWTQPPQSRVLPERFVVLTQSNERFIHLVAGEPVQDPLIVGLNPKNFTNQTFSTDAEGDLQVDPEILWLTDFTEAVRCGMGIAIPLTPEEKAQGFDKVLVLGVKNLDPAHAQRRLEELLENHHYKPKGMSLIPIGTATNNTDKKASGFLGAHDPDHGYAVEQGPALFDPAITDPRRVTDGQRLAAGLGIAASVLQHIAHSDGLEISHALTMNRLLSPATLGYFMEEILDSLFTQDAIHRTQNYFNQHVSGRGMLPSVRVGTQPYGVLVTTAFSRFRLYADETLPTLPEEGAVSPAELEAVRDRRFHLLLRAGLDWLGQDWQRIAATEVKSADNIDPDNPQAHFMNQLGLEAHSLVHFMRYGVNAASRRPTPQAGGPSVNFSAQDYFGPDAFLEKLRGLLKLTDAEWQAFQPRLKRSRLYKLRYLQDQAPLTGETIAPTLSETDSLPPNSYLAWLSQADPYALWNRNQIDSFPSRSLLFLLARHAVLLAYRDEALNLLTAEGLLSPEVRAQAGSPDHFHVYSPYLEHNTFATRWNYLFQSLEKLDGLFGNYFDPHSPFYQALRSRSQSLAEYLSHPATSQAGHVKSFQRLAGVKADCQALQPVPTAQLDRLLTEHLDLCSYRLDAWQLGLAHRRLTQQRANVPQGIHLGAFGWVENLRPGSARPLAGRVPDRVDPRRQGVIYHDPANQGFIHAPSLNHAMTAAMLRSGYFASRKTENLKNPMAVNLTSERVRMGLRLLEGVRQGVDVSILLGYQFERGLHERYQDRLELDALIYPFRRRFPGVPAVDQPLSPESVQSQVVNGLAILNAVRDELIAHNLLRPGDTLIEALQANPSHYPFGLSDQGRSLLPPQRTPELQAVLQEIDRLADAFDALGDLVMAESVYQVAQGNPTRAAAVVSALAEGKNPPEVEMINTPRTGAVVTQRVVLHLPNIDGTTLSPRAGLDATTLAQRQAQAAPPLWAGIPMTPRALVEPAVNYWLGETIGDPEQIRCWAEVLETETPVFMPVAISDLGLQPLDWVVIMGAGADEGASELNQRIVAHVRKTLQLAATVKIKLHTQERSDRLLKTPDERLSPSMKTLYEVAPLLRALSDIIHSSRACAADDLRLPPETTPEDPRLQDQAELRIRVHDARDRVAEWAYQWLDRLRQTSHDRSLDLLRVKASDYALDENAIVTRLAEFSSQVEDLRHALFQAADLGVPYAVPESVFGSEAADVRALLSQGQTALAVLLERLQTAQPLLDQSGVDAWVEAAKELLGKDLVVIPRFTASNAAELTAMAAEKDRWLNHLRSLDDPFPMDTWFQGLARVRKKMTALDLVQVMAPMFGQPPAELIPGQLPWQPGDYWVGAPYPETYQPGRNTLSLVQIHRPADDSQTHSALLLDEWTEVIPHTEEITGLTFHYNQPDATAPQSLLLAVTPEETGRWAWDDLVMTLLDTLALAKTRAVEPDQIDRTLFSQIVPAVLGEVVPMDLSADPDNPMGLQVMTDFALNTPPE